MTDRRDARPDIVPADAAPADRDAAGRGAAPAAGPLTGKVLAPGSDARSAEGRSAGDRPPARRRSPAVRYERIALVDLLDRLLAGGVVISGEVRLSIADVDLVNVSLRALITSVSSVLEHGQEDDS